MFVSVICITDKEIYWLCFNSTDKRHWSLHQLSKPSPDGVIILT